MSASPFTPKQGQYLAFIRDYIARYGQSPAESDIARRFMVAAPSAHGMVVMLERRGLIARTPGQGRSIRLLVPPEILPGGAASATPEAGSTDLTRLSACIAEAVEEELRAVGLPPRTAQGRGARVAERALERYRRPGGGSSAA